MPSTTSNAAPLTSSERRKRFRERNRHLTKERSIILPNEANDALLKLCGLTNLSASSILLAGLYGVSSLNKDHLIELANEAAVHYGKSLLEKQKPLQSETSGQAQGQRQ